LLRKKNCLTVLHFYSIDFYKVGAKMIDKKTYNEIGVHIPSILLPKEGIDMQKWSVVACDQYTSEPEYWRKWRKK